MTCAQGEESPREKGKEQQAGFSTHHECKLWWKRGGGQRVFKSGQSNLAEEGIGSGGSGTAQRANRLRHEI